MTKSKLTLQTFLRSTLFLLTLSFSQLSVAEIVNQKIEELNIEAQAEYLQGDKDKPVVLIVHGFLTTNKFHTVVAMARGLNEEGYSVLSPTLTLGINKRQSSVKCNSIHTHTLENDVIEIKDWVNWLTDQGYKKVVLLGHSSGSLEILEYISKYKTPQIRSAIFTSIFYLNGKELGTVEQEVEKAQNLLAKGQNKPGKYNFLFCKNNYFATPKSYLSYLKLERQYVLGNLQNLTMPTYTIMGSADKRYQSVGENWLTEIEATGTKLITVDGANHFFSSEHEFDLQDNLIAIMAEIAD